MEGTGWAQGRPGAGATGVGPGALRMELQKDTAGGVHMRGRWGSDWGLQGELVTVGTREYRRSETWGDPARLVMRRAL